MNQFYIKKLGGVIISGKSHLPIFEEIIDKKRIHIVPNFATNPLFVTESEITAKYASTEPLRILYMSNLIPKKGYNELADAFCLLNENHRKQIIIDFAGAFDSEQEKNIFLDKIEKFEHLSYHGIISEEAKRKLFKEAHIFCLPTSYFEGQPISILEAYASGCVVLTTGQSGILDIFQNEENGFLIEERSSIAVKNSIEKILHNKSELLNIAQHNAILAKEKYRQTAYINAIEKFLENSNK
jgi:glycosyltransferase involved in cell wall biosynthesis